MESFARESQRLVCDPGSFNAPQAITRLGAATQLLKIEQARHSQAPRSERPGWLLRMMRSVYMGWSVSNTTLQPCPAHTPVADWQQGLQNQAI